MKWVTWENVGVDRIGCAWLIRKYIDAKAKFLFVPRSAPLPAGAALHIHATDSGLGGHGEWMIRHDAGSLIVEPGHGKGDAALTGPAASLLLVLMRRRPVPDSFVTKRKM